MEMHENAGWINFSWINMSLWYLQRRHLIPTDPQVPSPQQAGWQITTLQSKRQGLKNRVSLGRVAVHWMSTPALIAVIRSFQALITNLTSASSKDHLGFARFRPKPKLLSPASLLVLATVTFSYFLLGRWNGSVREWALEWSSAACWEEKNQVRVAPSAVKPR